MHAMTELSVAMCEELIQVKNDALFHSWRVCLVTARARSFATKAFVLFLLYGLCGETGVTADQSDCRREQEVAYIWKQRE